MLTWTEIAESIRARWPVTSADGVSLSFTLELDGRRQRIVVQATRDDTAIAVVASVFSHRFLEPGDALKYNATAERGGLALERGSYVLRQVLQLDGLDRDRVDGAIRAAAVEATRLNRVFAPKPLPAEFHCAMFAYMAD